MIRSLRMLLTMVLLTGVIYPALITGIAHVAFPKKAKGSLLFLDGKIRGSSLIGQNFSLEKYFWPRPSMSHYRGVPSGGSQLGPTSLKLKKLVEIRRKHLLLDGKKPPIDLLFASGSGLDPHISSEAAYFQLKRIAKARKMPEETIRALIDRNLQKPFFLGDPLLCVLQLNMDLDQENYGK